MNPLIFHLNDGGRLKIDTLPLTKMMDYKQIGPLDCEGGGMLLGRFIVGTKDIVIDDVSVSMPKDIRKRYYFYRNVEEHQTILEAKWQESKGTCNYLGEWHTHPEPDPNPSSRDRKNWCNILKNTVSDAEKFLFIILGTTTLNVWEGLLTDRNITLVKDRRGKSKWQQQERTLQLQKIISCGQPPAESVLYVKKT